MGARDFAAAFGILTRARAPAHTVATSAVNANGMPVPGLMETIACQHTAGVLVRLPFEDNAHVWYSYMYSSTLMWPVR